MRWLVVGTFLLAACGSPQRVETVGFESNDDFDDPGWDTTPKSHAKEAPRTQPAQVRVMPRRVVRAKIRPRARVDMDFKNADLDNVFRMLATVGGMNIVLAPSVKGAVTLRLKGVEWDLAVQTICRAHNLEIIADGNVMLIRPRTD